MNEIQQYRQDSAKWMGIDKYYPWHPDQDHNRMAMMEDKLIDEKLYFRYSYNPETEGWQVYFQISENACPIVHNSKDKCIAFMKAWTEYYKSLNG